MAGLKIIFRAPKFYFKSIENSQSGNTYIFVSDFYYLRQDVVARREVNIIERTNSM
jgi:hypothetical protein